MLLRRALLGLLLSLPVACSADEEPGAGGAGDDLEETNPGDTPEESSLVGEFRVDSQFEALGSEGGIAEAAAMFREMSDDPNDPGAWLIDVMLDEVDVGVVRSAVNLARPNLDGWVNGLLAEGSSENFRDEAANIAAALEAMDEGLAVHSTLKVRAWTDDSSYRASHEVDALSVQVNGSPFQRSLSELGASPVSAQDLHISLTAQSEVAINDHEIIVPYGALARRALEEELIPAVSDATDIAGLLESFVDCEAVGASIADYLSVGSASTYDGPCNLALSTAASQLTNHLANMDAQTPATLTLNGFAQLASDGGFRDGNWYGSLSLGELEERPLTEGQGTFTAERR